MPASWFTPVDNYCERIDASFWSEPLNAATNGSFVLAAAYGFFLWRRAGGRDWPGLALIGVILIVGIGSFLFHTFANRWSRLADVLPIALFIYGYFLLALRRFLRLSLIAALAATGIFALFNMIFPRLWFGVLPGVSLDGSVGYIPALAALLAVGCLCLVVKVRRPGFALLAAAGIFALSLFFRSIDGAVCSAFPTGTHFLWHVLNGVVLLVLARAAIAYPAGDRAKASP
jgi:hypothetical protein